MNTAHWTTSRMLSTAARLNKHHQNLALMDLDVTLTGATTLNALSDSGPTNQTHLAALIHVQAQTMGKVLEKLERKGLVSRRSHTRHGRSLHTRITERGNKLLRCIDRVAGASAGSAELADQLLRNALITVITRLEASPA